MFQKLIARIAGLRLAKKLKLEEGQMVENKPWYQSKGVWTGVVTVVSGAYELARVSLAPQFGIELPAIPPVVYTFLGAMGIYARTTATRVIG